MNLEEFRDFLHTGKRPEELAEEEARAEASKRMIDNEGEFDFESEAKIEVSADIFSNQIVFKCRGREARIEREELIERRVDQARHFVLTTLIHKLGVTINEADRFLDASTVTVDRDKLGWKLDGDPGEEKGRNPIKGKHASMILIDDPVPDHPNCRCVTTPVEEDAKKGDAELWRGALFGRKGKRT